jgi:hypothetical protein
MLLMDKKKWTDKEKFFIKEYTGRYTNKYMSKKFKTNLMGIYNQQRLQGVNIINNLAGHDLLTQDQFAEELGLTIDQMKALKKNNFIEFKNLGRYVVIPKSEVERIGKFFLEFISLSSASKILSMNQATLRFRISIGQFETKTMNDRNKGVRIFVNKKQIFEHKKFLSDTYSLKEFAELIFYDISYVRKKIKIGEIAVVIDYKISRIPKTELERFTRDNK